MRPNATLRVGDWYWTVCALSLLAFGVACNKAPLSPNGSPLAEESAAASKVAANDPQNANGPLSNGESTSDNSPSNKSDPSGSRSDASTNAGLTKEELDLFGDTRVEPEERPPFEHRVLAPSLDGGVAWLNTKDPIDLKDLKGKWVLLDFWTYCCINCMHILPELNKLEKAHPNDVVVIGVHSAKFDAEQDSKQIAEAVLRHEIEHPVVNDAEHVIWDRFRVRAWPTLIVIDPEGYIVAKQSAEIPWEALDEFVKKFSPYYERKGLLKTNPIRFDLESAKAKRTPLRYPGKILADGEGRRLFIADSNHNRIVICNFDGTNAVTIGDGTIGQRDGDFATARFHHPQGMALKNETLYVADTENHLLRKIDLTKKIVSTIAGIGRQARSEWPGIDFDSLRRGAEVPERFYGPPLKTGLNSPWDLWIHESDLFIAMAGPHQIWRMPLDESEIGIYSGNGREDIVDGPTNPSSPFEPGFASFAQPSGLASDGKSLFVADSEGSSIRAVPFDPKKEVTTVVGTSERPGGRLFHFGDADGKGSEILLQHCLGVAYHDGAIYVADTYNNKIKVVNPEERTAKTLAGTGKAGSSDDPPQFNQPAGLSHADEKLFVADTNNHLIRTIDLQNGNKVGTLEIKGLQSPEPMVVAQVASADDKPSFPNPTEVKVAAARIKSKEGKIRFAVKLKLPAGFKINALAPMRYFPEAVAEKGPLDRAALGKTAKVDPPNAEFEIALPVAAASGDDTIKISLNYNYCQAGPDGECKFGSVIWTIPIKLSADAENDVAPLEFEVP